MEINSQSAEIAENLALIFSVALIHVLCQPRPINWMPKLTWTKSEEEILPKLGGSEEIALLLAAGVLIATPCNHAIRNLFKNKKQTFGEGSNVRRESQRDGDDQFEQSSGEPSVILHEAEVSAGWGEDWNGGANNSSSGDAGDTGLVVGGMLTVIKEQADVESEDSMEEKEGCEVADEKVADQMASLSIVEDSHKEENAEGEKLPSLELQENDIKENTTKNEDFDEAEEDEVESDQESEGVFEVEDYNLDADSQSGIFGNGEDDSDEVDLDEEENNGLGPVSSGDDSVFVSGHNHESRVLQRGFPSPVEHNGAFENDIDSYYDEFYNISGDENINGFDMSDNITVNNSGRSVQSSHEVVSGSLAGSRSVLGKCAEPGAIGGNCNDDVGYRKDSSLDECLIRLVDGNKKASYDDDEAVCSGIINGGEIQGTGGAGKR